MTEEKFRIGSQVRLNSGGVDMTVENYEDEVRESEFALEKGVHCVWHDTLGQPYKEVYREECLVVVKP